MMELASAMTRLKAILLLALLLTLCRAAPGFGQASGNSTDESPVGISAQSGNATSPPGAAASKAAFGEPLAGTTWTEPKTGMVFNWVPPGCFLMGSPENEADRNQDEGPQHEVCLSGFWLGRTEVTQGQWRAIKNNNPSLIANGEDYPVDMISWDMAKEYAAALSKKSGGTFRLPTEAEWEYAARAGTRTAYAFGNEISQDQASFEKRYSLPAEPTVSKRKSRRKAAKPKARIWPNMHTHAAGSFQPNAFGLHDMHGNVWEWCEDVYDRDYYSRSPRENPQNADGGVSRVLRGGSWVTKSTTLRSANRSRAWPDLRTAFYGLRLVRSAPGTKDQAAPVSPR